ncbi:MAG TPA: thiol peroxidase [Anaerolineales bacterium]|nr:thiol peroxidase [Anaerolineales bacterium]
MTLIERTDVIKLGDKFATVIGEDVAVGQLAPAFKAQVGSWGELAPWSDVDVLAQTTGKVRILTPLPSLSTGVCDAETRRFNQEAADLGDGVVVIAVSTDLPPTQKSWCAGAGVDRVYTVSDHMDLDFGAKYGTWLKERRWHRRAVFVIGKDDRIVYAAYMSALGEQPTYEDVIAAARQALGA